MDLSDRAKPLADSELQRRIFKTAEQAVLLKKLKRGANEATKALNRDMAEIIVLAADATPLEIILHLPLLCEDKNVPYIFVPSMAALGAACGTSRNVVACALVKKFNDNALETEIQSLKIAIEKAFCSS